VRRKSYLKQISTPYHYLKDYSENARYDLIFFTRPRIENIIVPLYRTIEAHTLPQLTTRISLNDNLLKRCSPAGIESTMGHEMGHYVLNHQFKGLVFNGVEVVLMFALLNWSLNAGLARWGESWGIRGITDLAVLPFAALLLTIFSFVLTPVDNTISRTMEYEADMYGINAGQQPDGEAEVDLMLGEYRKLDPGPIEEFVFFDHPSGRTRITAAMRWKAEHLVGAPLWNGGQ
jgi:STE24 endopeptidase